MKLIKLMEELSIADCHEISVRAGIYTNNGKLTSPFGGKNKVEKYNRKKSNNFFKKLEEGKWENKKQK